MFNRFYQTIYDQIIISSFLYCGLIYEFSRGFQNLSIFWIIVASIGGWLVADLFSGFVHFIGDNIEPNHNNFLAKLGYNFTLHHIIPSDITKHSFWFICIETHYFSCLVIFIAYCFDSKSFPAISFFFYCDCLFPQLY